MVNIRQPRRNCYKNFSTSLVGTICCKKTYDQYIFLFISILFLKINQCIMIFYEQFFFYRGIKDLSGLSSLSTSWYWGVASWSSRCKRLVIFYFLRERVEAFFFWGGGREDHMVFRENGGKISRHQRSVKGSLWKNWLPTHCQWGEGRTLQSLKRGIRYIFPWRRQNLTNPPLKG